MLAKLSADPGTVQQFGLVWLDAKLRRARPMKAVPRTNPGLPFGGGWLLPEID